MYTAKITITIRDSILDPQGKAVEHSLKSIGFSEIEDTRIGKHIELKINAKSKEAAEKISREACEKLLANSVMEDFKIEISDGGKS